MEPNTHDQTRRAKRDAEALAPHASAIPASDRDLEDLDTHEHAAAGSMSSDEDRGEMLAERHEEADEASHDEDDHDAALPELGKGTEIALAAGTIRRKPSVASGLIRRYPAVALTAFVAVGFLMGRTIARRFT